jgi:hypothetical protein
MKSMIKLTDLFRFSKEAAFPMKSVKKRIVTLEKEKTDIKKGRKVHIHGQIPALTRIVEASPRGVEPLLQE